MTSHADKINEFLSSMGFGVRLGEAPGNPPDFTIAVVNHMGTVLNVCKDREFFLIVTITFGFVPKSAIAPLFRRILELHNTMAGPYFALNPADNTLSLKMVRSLDGLELIEFKTILDTLASSYWQVAVPMVQQFQIPQQQTV